MSGNLFSLEGNTAVVTGCTRGIGQAIAIGLAEAGADIILIQVSFAPPMKPSGCTSKLSLATYTETHAWLCFVSGERLT